MDEFALIDAVVAALGDATRGAGVVLGPGDDCAIAHLPPDTELASSIDALVCGVHFPASAPGDLVGRRALGVAVSDLAAMGATPLHAIVAVTLEDERQSWLVDFARGMGEAARAMGIAVAGGNLARGPLNIAVSAHGFVPRGQALVRSGARPGDRVFVSGCIGAAGLAIAELERPAPAAERLSRARPGESDYPLARYWLPSPRLVLGISLRAVASAAIDVSDGLLADLGHLCRASGVGAKLDGAAIPLAPGAELAAAVQAGDDYELLFTVPAARLSALQELAADVVEIGTIVEAPGIRLQVGERDLEVQRVGYRHFR